MARVEIKIPDEFTFSLDMKVRVRYDVVIIVQ
jgi:hypothetical protein